MNGVHNHMGPKVSVILPVYNGELFIRDAINSIISQTYINFELIIINDASTDKTAQIINSFVDDRIKVITNEYNLGISLTLNRAIENSNGELIARMDADDMADTNRLKKQVDFFMKNSGYSLLATCIEPFSDTSIGNDERLKELETWYNSSCTDKEIRESLYIGNCLNHPSVMYKKSHIIQVGGYRNQYDYAEDYDLFLRIIKIGKVHKLKEKLLKYRVHTKQISTEYREEQQERETAIKVELLVRNYINIQNVVIWGASKGGRLIVKQLIKQNVRISGFIDIDPLKKGVLIEGYPVLGTYEEISKIKNPFIIVATSPGRSFAIRFLDGIGMVRGVDYQVVW